MVATVKLFGVIDRFVIREVLPPTILGFITYTFLVVMRRKAKIMGWRCESPYMRCDTRHPVGGFTAG